MTDSELYELAERVIRNAKQNRRKLATAESCTGGWIGKMLTDIPGSSSSYMGSLVAYHNDVKEHLLGVPPNILKSQGAVSEASAFHMVKNCAQLFNVTHAVSVTGIAGPSGGSDEKPVGLVYMGIFRDDHVSVEKFSFPSTSRETIRRLTVIEALRKLE